MELMETFSKQLMDLDNWMFSFLSKGGMFSFRGVFSEIRLRLLILDSGWFLRENDGVDLT